MSLKVLEFKRRDEPHASGVAICGNCKHEWVAVAPAGQRNLECPQCSTERGAFKFPYGPNDGCEGYQCNCGSEDFFIMRRGSQGNGAVYCRGCGSETTGWFE